MEYNNFNVDLQSVIDYIDEQKKEKSKRWAERLVDKIHIEKTVVFQDFTEEEEANFNKVLNLIKGQDQKKMAQIIRKLSEKEKEDYDKIAKQKDQKERLEFSIKGMEDLEKFLEIINELKEEVNNLKQ